MELKIFTKTIEEYAVDGDLMRKLHVSYTPGNNMGSERMFEIVLSPENCCDGYSDEAEFIIDEETVDLGLPVQRTREWAMLTRAMDEEPEVISLTSWNWRSGKIDYSISGDTAEEALYRDFIAQIIEKL